MRLTLSCEKGGVGKTALAACLARSFAGRGMKILFVDLDVQGNGSDALADCQAAGSTKDLFGAALDAGNVPQEDGGMIAVCKADPSLADLGQDDIAAFSAQADANLRIFEEKGFAIVIDTPPTLGATLATALLISDQVLIPVEPEGSSISGAANVAVTVRNLQRLRPSLKLMGIVVNRMKRRPRQIRNLSEIRSNPILGRMILPQEITDRDSIAESVSDHVPLKALARKRTAARKACAEIEGLAGLVMAKWTASAHA